MMVLGACFAMSFVGRLAVFAADLADDTGAKQPDERASSASISLSTTKDAGDGERKTAVCESTELAATLKNRIAALDARENAIARKQAQMETYAAQIEKRLEELASANAEMKQFIDAIEGRQRRDVEQLAAIYNSMKPKLASEILDEMDIDFASGLLAQLDTESAAAILAGMEPQKAYAISVKFANRSRR
ncbi:MAG: hypothetical protein AAGJ73_07065 [Pseudomonadota bacterium]